MLVQANQRVTSGCEEDQGPDFLQLIKDNFSRNGRVDVLCRWNYTLTEPNRFRYPARLPVIDRCETVTSASSDLDKVCEKISYPVPVRIRQQDGTCVWRYEVLPVACAYVHATAGKPRQSVGSRQVQEGGQVLEDGEVREGSGPWRRLWIDDIISIPKRGRCF